MLKKETAKTYIHLTMHQQEAIDEWLKSSEVLYNKIRAIDAQPHHIVTRP